MTKHELEQTMLALELRERKAVIARLGLTFTHAYLNERVERTKEPRRGQFKDGAEKVLRHKLAEVSERAHFAEGDQMCQELSYVMAALAGEPHKEILVIGSANAAAYVSFGLLKSMGWKCLHKDASSRRHSYTACKEEWFNVVRDIPIKVGTCFRYAPLLTRTWRPGGTPDFTECELILRKYGRAKWFRRVWPWIV